MRNRAEIANAQNLRPRAVLTIAGDICKRGLIHRPIAETPRIGEDQKNGGKQNRQSSKVSTKSIEGEEPPAKGILFAGGQKALPGEIEEEAGDGAILAHVQVTLLQPQILGERRKLGHREKGFQVQLFRSHAGYQVNVPRAGYEQVKQPWTIEEAQFSHLRIRGAAHDCFRVANHVESGQQLGTLDLSIQVYLQGSDGHDGKNAE